MEVQGINLDALGEHEVACPYPPEVKGRMAHLDGDFIAYQCSYDDSLSFDTMANKARTAITHLRRMCGAEFVRLHLTANSSTKGGRYDAALLKEYQATRKREKPAQLENMRRFMRDHFGAVYWTDQEADDGMAQANALAHQYGKPELSVIYSKDKDLSMALGWRLNPDTFDLEYIDRPGSLRLTEGKTKKLVGTGPAFFWAQMLMGDQADNIGGLPAIYGMSDYKDGMKCGPVAAYSLLEDRVTEYDMLDTVARLYKNYGDAVGFKNWRDGSPLTWKQAFWSEATLLWMRRKKAARDVQHYIFEVRHGTTY